MPFSLIHSLYNMKKTSALFGSTCAKKYTRVCSIMRPPSKCSAGNNSLHECVHVCRECTHCPVDSLDMVIMHVCIMIRIRTPCLAQDVYSNSPDSIILTTQPLPIPLGPGASRLLSPLMPCLSCSRSSSSRWIRSRPSTVPASCHQRALMLCLSCVSLSVEKRNSLRAQSALEAN